MGFERLGQGEAAAVDGLHREIRHRLPQRAFRLGAPRHQQANQQKRQKNSFHQQSPFGLLYHTVFYTDTQPAIVGGGMEGEKGTYQRMNNE